MEVEIRKWQWKVTVISIIFGVLAGLQLKAQKDIPLDNLPSRRIDVLIDRVYQLETDNNNLKDEIGSLRKKQAAQDILAKMNAQAVVMSGLTPVKGPGLQIVLTEDKKFSPNENSNLYLIHAEDLLDTINSIFSAGAEAVSINGQRIVTVTYIFCNGPTITVNNTRIAPPFEIKAIGDPDAMESFLTLRGSSLQTLQGWKIDVKITKQKEVEIPAYSGPAHFKYVTPVVKEGS